MDILEQIVAGIAKGMLPQGKTLAEVKPFDEGEQRMLELWRDAKDAGVAEEIEEYCIYRTNNAKKKTE